MAYKDVNMHEVDEAMQRSWHAFLEYRKKSLKERSNFLRAIAMGLEAMDNQLIETAGKETHLEKSRLKVELQRTIFQLKSYAEACEDGNWLDIRIDTADVQRNPPKPDLRKMLVPLGPVVVFGASNFPFAYSTAGGDTACALAAGCSVVVKAHPAHAETSELVAGIVQKAIRDRHMPGAVFIHLHGSSFEVGAALVQHPMTRAVGFTGSYQGGRALFDLANRRPEPIPVFAEMSSVNPVFLLPEKLSVDTKKIASMLAGSITQSVGQFCTNPGILVGIKSESLTQFEQLLGEHIRQAKPATMLHAGIAENFIQKRDKLLAQRAVKLVAQTQTQADEQQGIPTIATIDACHFLEDATYRQEVFGPFSILVHCSDRDEMLRVAEVLEGQLTCSLMATGRETIENPDLVERLKDKCGRLVFNGVPTGVEVALGMHHGGPFPATTDSRFTSVGADGIKRFARPVCYQNWSDDLLPVELKNENHLRLWRTVNNRLTREGIN